MSLLNKNHGKERRAPTDPFRSSSPGQPQVNHNFCQTMETTPKTPADSLISALKERNISVKRGEIETALNNATSKAENTKWIAEHLNYDTLLTREELALYGSPFSLSWEYIDLWTWLIDSIL